MKITNSNGREQEIVPTNITFITGPMGTESKTRILGVLPVGAMSIDDDAEKFIASLPNKDNFVKLTFAINGAHFWANATAVTALRAATQNDIVTMPLAASVIHFGHAKRFLSTEFKIAQDLIEAAGGHPE